MEKIKPTLADYFVNRKFTNTNTIAIPLHIVKAVQEKVKVATKFVFNDPATRRVGDVIRDLPTLLVREANLVRAPYRHTWYEFNRALLWRQIYQDQPDKLANEPATHSIMNGVLVTDDLIFIVSGGTITPIKATDWSDAWLTPFGYQMHVYTKDLHKIITDIDALYWGSTCNQIPSAELQRITENFSLAPLMVQSKWPTLARVTPEFYGDLRNVIAFLLMLNRPSVTSFSEPTRPQRGWVKNKNVAYAPHRTVTITLDARPTLRMLGTSGESGVRKRLHEVRGHYAHDQTTRDYGAIGCLHDWQTTDSHWQPMTIAPEALPLHGVCKVCSGKRWWRNEHERGDESLGRVTHDQYIVRS